MTKKKAVKKSVQVTKDKDEKIREIFSEAAKKLEPLDIEAVLLMALNGENVAVLKFGGRSTLIGLLKIEEKRLLSSNMSNMSELLGLGGA